MGRRKHVQCPSQEELVEPIYKALIELGGSATNDEILEFVIRMLNLPDSIVDLPRKGESQRTELEYRLAWGRTRLKKYGAITNSKRGIWMITPEFSNVVEIRSDDVTAFIRGKKINDVGIEQADKDLNDSELFNDGVEIPEELEPWRQELAEILYNMNPFAFERLAQLLLRECGFTQVVVTKKTGDGGIDGTGKLRINGIFSFNVAFQCKRYSGSVSAGDIRDFRGSLTTDIEKGVFITTGRFTRAAKEEASNAGKQQIDLIDGDEFINKLIEYRIGVQEKTVFEVIPEFFEKV